GRDRAQGRGRLQSRLPPHRRQLSPLMGAGDRLRARRQPNLRQARRRRRRGPRGSVVMSTTLAIFAIILLVTLGITYWAAQRTKTTSEFYAADSRLTAAQNGFALAGDWCSAAAFLGFSGLTALYGMDGAFYALGPLVAFCTVLFLIAEPLRNTGKYTLGDVIRFRMQTRTSLLAAIAGTVVVNFAYLMSQMAGAGVLVRLLPGLSYAWAVIFA